MLRDLFPQRLGLVLTMLTVCQGLDTAVGSIPEPGEPGVLESWCGDLLDRWEILEDDPNYITPAGADGYHWRARSACAAFGGAVSFRGMEGDTFGYGGIQRQEFVDLTGRQIVFRFDPRDEGAREAIGLEYIFADFNRAPFLDPNPYIEFVIRQGGRDSGPFGDPNDVTVLIPYDPAAHRWFRFWHDEVSGEVGIDTAGDCGPWVPQATGDESLLSRGIDEARVLFASEVYQDPGDPPIQESVTRIGTIYLGDYGGSLSGLQLCQGLDTAVGSLPEPEEGPLEDWCDDGPGRWDNITSGFGIPFPPGADGLRSTYRQVCASHGGILDIRGFGGETAFEHAELAVQSPFRFDLTGRQVFARFEPWGVPYQFNFIEVYRPSAETPPVFGLGVGVEDWDPNDLRIYFFGYADDANEFVSNVPYDPGTDKWIRFWHDPVAGEAGIDTAGDCGPWTNRLTMATAVVPAGLAWGHFAEAYPEGDGLIQNYRSSLSQIYQAPYPGGVEPYRLCQDLDTAVGSLPAEEEVFDDWCGDWTLRWTDLFGGTQAPEDRFDLSAACNLGLAWRKPGTIGRPQSYIVSDPGYYGPDFGQRLFDLRDRALFFKLRPAWDSGAGDNGFFELISYANFDFSFFSEFSQGGQSYSPGTPAWYLQLFYAPSFPADVNEEVVLTPYDPDGDHAWVRVIYSTAHGRWFVQTGAPCGTWTTRLTAAIPESSAQDLAMTLFMQANFALAGGVSLTHDGYTSPIYLAPFHPDMIADWSP